MDIEAEKPLGAGDRLARRPQRRILAQAGTAGETRRKRPALEYRARHGKDGVMHNAIAKRRRTDDPRLRIANRERAVAFEPKRPVGKRPGEHARLPVEVAQEGTDFRSIPFPGRGAPHRVAERRPVVNPLEETADSLHGCWDDALPVINGSGVEVTSVGDPGYGWRIASKRSAYFSARAGPRPSIRPRSAAVA